MENSSVVIGRKRDREEYDRLCSPSQNSRESRLSGGLFETFIPRGPQAKRQRIETSPGLRRTQPRRKRSRSQEGPSTHASQANTIISPVSGNPGISVSSLDNSASQISGDLQSPSILDSGHGLRNEQSTPSTLVGMASATGLPTASVDVNGSADSVQNAPSSIEEPYGEENAVHSTSVENQVNTYNEDDEEINAKEEEEVERQIRVDKPLTRDLFRDGDDEFEEMLGFSTDYIREAHSRRPYRGPDVYEPVRRVQWSHLPENYIRGYTEKHMQREVHAFSTSVLNRGLTAKEERVYIMQGRGIQQFPQIVFHPLYPDRKARRQSRLRWKITLDQHQKELEKVEEAKRAFAQKEGAKTRENTPEIARSASQEMIPEQPAEEEEEVQECEVSYDEEYKRERIPRRMVKIVAPSTVDAFCGERVLETVPYGEKYRALQNRLVKQPRRRNNFQKNERLANFFNDKRVREELRELEEQMRKEEEKRKKQEEKRKQEEERRLEEERKLAAENADTYIMEVPYKDMMIALVIPKTISPEEAMVLARGPAMAPALEEAYNERKAKLAAGDNGENAARASGSGQSDSENSAEKKTGSDSGCNKTRGPVMVNMEVQTDEDLANGYSNDVHDNGIDAEADEELDTDSDEVDSDSQTPTADEVFDVWWNTIVPPMLRTTNPKLFEAVNDLAIKEYPYPEQEFVDIPESDDDKRVIESKFVPAFGRRNPVVYNAYLDYQAAQSTELSTKRVRAIEGYLAPMREEAAEFARETRNMHLELLRKAKEAKESEERSEQNPQ